MKAINEELRIYQINLEDLTVKQIRKITDGWNNEDRIGGLAIFYEKETDMLFIGPGAVEAHISLCIKALSEDPKIALEKLKLRQSQMRLDVNREIIAILSNVITTRQEKKRYQPIVVNPNARFISIDGDIFQISKIVSVKIRDEGNRYYIDCYITNRRASIRKEFNSKQERNSEFERIQKILEAAA